MAELFLDADPKKRGGGRDVILSVVSGAIALLGSLVLLWILIDLLRMGSGQLSLSFFYSEPLESGRAGGIGPVLVSTLLILCCCLLVAVPLGIAPAFFLTEIAGANRRLARFLIFAVDLLASIPSIVFGLFGMAFFCLSLGLGFSILSGGLTLACMVLPILMRTSLSAVLSIPSDLRAASAALGLSKTSTLLRVIVPAAAPGILVGFTIGIARALSETAALIFTSGYATRWPDSLFDSGRSLSIHIYDLAMNIPNGGARASASALVLMLLLLGINVFTQFLTERWLPRK